jgi:hypothetical protein
MYIFRMTSQAIQNALSHREKKQLMMITKIWEDVQPNFIKPLMNLVFEYILDWMPDDLELIESSSSNQIHCENRSQIRVISTIPIKNFMYQEKEYTPPLLEKRIATFRWEINNQHHVQTLTLPPLVSCHTWTFYMIDTHLMLENKLLAEYNELSNCFKPSGKVMFLHDHDILSVLFSDDHSQIMFVTFPDEIHNHRDPLQFHLWNIHSRGGRQDTEARWSLKLMYQIAYLNWATFAREWVDGLLCLMFNGQTEGHPNGWLYIFLMDTRSVNFYVEYKQFQCKHTNYYGFGSRLHYCHRERSIEWVCIDLGKDRFFRLVPSLIEK